MLGFARNPRQLQYEQPAWQQQHITTCFTLINVYYANYKPTESVAAGMTEDVIHVNSSQFVRQNDQSSQLANQRNTRQLQAI